MSLALWLVIYLLITYAVGRLYEVSLGWKSAGYAFYPGMLVAALGRLAACLGGQQKPGSMDLFRSGGPSSAGADRLPGGWWFRFLYAIGPFVLSLAFFVVAWNVLDQPLDPARTLPTLELETSAAEKGAGALGGQFGAVLDSIGNQRLADWKMWVFLYLGFCFIVAPAPGRDDLVSVGAFAGIAGLIVLALDLMGVEVVASRLYSGPFWEGFSFMVGMALIVFAATIVFLLPIKFIRRSKEH